MATFIEQLETAGVLDASRLTDTARDHINDTLTQEQVANLIDVKKNLPGDTAKPWHPQEDGSIF